MVAVLPRKIQRHKVGNKLVVVSHIGPWIGLGLDWGLFEIDETVYRRKLKLFDLARPRSSRPVAASVNEQVT